VNVLVFHVALFLRSPAIYLNETRDDKRRLMVAPTLRLVDCDAVWRAVAAIVG
jgi:hypothetical protein